MIGTAQAAAGIGVHIADWRPEAIKTEDVITSQCARELAATLDLDDEFADADQLPLLWQ
jgi:3-methylfumaryl-CoA hydratase